MEKHIVDPKLIINDCKDVLKVFDAHKVPIFLAYGAVLGSQREKDFIKWDDDVDLVVTAKIDYKTRKSIGWMLHDLGFQPQPILFKVFGRMELSEIGYNGSEDSGIIVCERKFKFSIFFFKEENCPQHGREMVCYPKYGSNALISSPARFYDKPAFVKLRGVKFMVPSPIKEYLEFTYGDWKNPLAKRHAYQYFEEHGKDKPSMDISDKNEAVIYNKNKYE
jgi:hypothetical protein